MPGTRAKKRIGLTFSEVYDYLRSRGLSRNHALGMAQNIEAESNFDPHVVNSIGATGLFQHLGDRREKLIRFIQGDLSNWRGQIDFALQERDIISYLAREFETPQDATKHFTIHFERPENKRENAEKRAVMLTKRLEKLPGRFKDGGSVAEPKEKGRFVIPGVEGYLNIPMQELREAIGDKRTRDELFDTAPWQPAEPDPEVALPAPLRSERPSDHPFADDEPAMRRYLRGMGVEGTLQASKDLAFSLNNTWGVSPDQTAQVLEIARRNGVSEDVVAGDPEKWASMEEARRIYARITERNEDGSFMFPTAVEFLRNPDKMRVANDDVDWITAIDQGIKASRREGESYLQTLGRDFAAGTVAFAGAFSNYPGTMARVTYELYGASMINKVAEVFGKRDVARDEAPEWLTDNSMTQFFDAWENQVSAYSAPGGELFPLVERVSQGDFFALLGLPREITRGVAYTAPQVVSIVIGGMSMLVGTVFAEEYNAAREEGKVPVLAATDAALTAGVEYATEKMGTERLVKQIFRGTAKKGVGGIAKEGTIQFIEEFAASVGGSYVDVLTGSEAKDTRTVVLEGVAEGSIGLGTGIGMSSSAQAVGVAARQVAKLPEAGMVFGQVNDLTKKIIRKNQEQSAFNTIREGIGESALAQRDEDSAKEYVNENLRQNGLDQNVYVDPAAFVAYQENLSDQQKKAIWQYFGISPEAVSAAIEAGESIPIPKAEAAIAEKKFDIEGVWDQLDESMRFFNEDVNVEEIDMAVRNIEKLNEELKKKVMEIQEQFTLPEQLKSVREVLIREQKMPAEEVDVNMMVMMAGFSSIAKRLGIPVNEYVEDVLGFSVEASKEDVIRGMTEMQPGRTVLTVFKNASRDTFMHEVGHVFQNEIGRILDSGVELDEDFRSSMEEMRKKDPEEFVNLFTAYLSEGQAPSIKLVEPFRMFRKYIQQVYRTVGESLGVELSDDARRFFDLLLASQTDIDSAGQFYAQLEELEEKFTEEVEGEETEVGSEAAKDTNDKKKEAVHTAEEKQIKQYLRAYFDNVKDKSAIKAETTNLVNDLPEYKAIKTVREAGGFRMQDVTDFISVEDATELKEDKKGLFSKAKNPKKYITPIDAAFQAGFNSVEEMFDAIRLAPPKKDKINELFEKELNRIEESVKSRVLHTKDGTSATPADEAMHDEKFIAGMLAEAAYMAEMAERKQMALDRKIVAQALNTWAKRFILRLPLKTAARVKHMLIKESTAAKRAIHAMERDKWDEAYTYQEDRLRWFYAAKQGIDARKFLDKMRRRYSVGAVLSKLTPGKGRTGVENQYADIVIALMNEFNVGSKIKRDGTVVRPEAFEGKKAWQEVVRDIDESVLEYLPDWIVKGEKPEWFISWEDLTYEQVQELDGALQSLITFGSDKLYSMNEADWKSFSNWKDRSIESMRGLKEKKVSDPATWWGQLQRKMARAAVSFTKFEFLFDRLDGYVTGKGKGFGPLRSFFNSLIAAEDQSHTIKHEVIEAAAPAKAVLADAMQRLERDYGVEGRKLIAGRRYKSVEIPGLPVPEVLKKKKGYQSFTADMLVFMAYNLGNAGNREVLKSGYNFTEAQCDLILSLFTKKELEAFQAVGDATELLFKYSDKTHFALSNRRMAKVEPEPMEVLSADGQMVNLRGWYYPLKYDNVLSGRHFTEEEMARQELNAVMYRTTPEAGHTKARKAGVSMAPELSESVWVQHVERAAKYASHSLVLRDAARLFGNSDWQEQLDVTLGAEESRLVRKEIRKWISDQTLPYVPKMRDDMFQRALISQHRLGVSVILGFNLGVALNQRLGILNAMSVLGQDGKGSWRYLNRARKKVAFHEHLFGRSTDKTYKELLKVSAQLRIREDHLNKILLDMKQDMVPTGRHKGTKFFGRRITIKDVQEFGFEILKSQDRSIIMPIYLASVEKFMEINTEIRNPDVRLKKAYEYADSIIRAHQPGSALAEMNPLERKDSMMKLWTAFMSFQFTFGGRLLSMAEAWRSGAVTAKQMGRFFAYEVLAASFAYNIFRFSVTMEWPEDWQEWLQELFVWGPINQAVAWVPFARNIPFALEREGPDIAKNIFLFPAAKNITTQIEGVRTMYKFVTGEEEFEALLYALAKSVEAGTGIPFVRFVESTKKSYNNLSENLE